MLNHYVYVFSKPLSGISPEMALRLSKVFGRTPEGWLRLQLQYALWKAKQNVDIDNLERIAA
jgi:plasmid maintenance system antidote protein VapI